MQASQPPCRVHQRAHILRRGRPTGAVAQHLLLAVRFPVGKAKFALEVFRRLTRQNGESLVGGGGAVECHAFCRKRRADLAQMRW